MRRKDREITEFDQIITIMEKCDVCRLAIPDEPVPYLVPLNFGLEVKDNTILLYFHGAMEGRKMELLKKNPHVAFEMDCSHEFVLSEQACSCTMEYECVMGAGLVTIANKEEKEHGFHCIMDHYYTGSLPYNETAMSKTSILILKVKTVSGKALKK